MVDSASTVCPVIDTAAGTLISSCRSGLAICTYDEFGTYCDTCGIISGIASIGSIEAFHLYPNPVSGSVSISFKMATSNLMRLQIVNMFGLEVYHTTLDAIAGLNKETFDVSILPNGVYMLVAGNGFQKQTQRFVVAR